MASPILAARVRTIGAQRGRSRHLRRGRHARVPSASCGSARLRGAGALPVSSQRWHHSTRPTANERAVAASHGLESQIAPPSSITMSFSSSESSTPASFPVGISTPRSGSVSHRSARQVLVWASAECIMQVSCQTTSAMWPAVQLSFRTFDLNTCSDIFGVASIPSSSQGRQRPIIALMSPSDTSFLAWPRLIEVGRCCCCDHRGRARASRADGGPALHDRRGARWISTSRYFWITLIRQDVFGTRWRAITSC